MLLAMMKIRTRGANRLLGLKRHNGWSAFPRAGLTGSSSVRTVIHSLAGVIQSAASSVQRTRLKRLTGFPDGPYDACQFVGHRNGSLAVAATALEFQPPGTQAVRMRTRLGAHQDGAGTVNQQRAQIGIALLADAAQ